MFQDGEYDDEFMEEQAAMWWEAEMQSLAELIEAKTKKQGSLLRLDSPGESK